jgi:hypothetical protein
MQEQPLDRTQEKTHISHFKDIEEKIIRIVLLILLVISSLKLIVVEVNGFFH